MKDTILKAGESDADACRRLGWNAGTRIIGDEGYGPTVIEITAVGKRGILAMQISHKGQLVEDPESQEHGWTLTCRDWKAV